MVFYLTEIETRNWDVTTNCWSKCSCT